MVVWSVNRDAGGSSCPPTWMKDERSLGRLFPKGGIRANGAAAPLLRAQGSQLLEHGFGDSALAEGTARSPGGLVTNIMPVYPGGERRGGLPWDF
jgi:hypothetical protein